MDAEILTNVQRRGRARCRIYDAWIVETEVETTRARSWPRRPAL